MKTKSDPFRKGFFTVASTLNPNAAKEYAELVEYLEPEEKAELERKLDQLPKDEKLATQIQQIQQIQQGQWEELFAKCDRQQFPLQALHCLRAGLLTSMQFCTSQQFFNVWTHPDNRTVRIEPVFKAGKRVLNSCNMIDATMQLASSSLKAYILELKKEIELKQMIRRSVPSFARPTVDETLIAITRLDSWEKVRKAGLKDWSPKEEEEFYRQLVKLPPSEQSFLLVPDPLFGKSGNETSVMQQINYRLGFNALSRLMVSGRAMVMIPSKGMMLAYLPGDSR